jgi:hypothetical protein
MIREYKTTLIAEKGRAEKRTIVIDGKIKVIELDLKKFAEIEIIYKNWIIFSGRLREGNYYLPLKVEPVAPTNEIMPHSAADIIINGTLKIKMNGATQNKLNFIIRWEI